MWDPLMMSSLSYYGHVSRPMYIQYPSVLFKPNEKVMLWISRRTRDRLLRFNCASAPHAIFDSRRRERAPLACFHTWDASRQRPLISVSLFRSFAVLSSHISPCGKLWRVSSLRRKKLSCSVKQRVVGRATGGKLYILPAACWCHTLTSRTSLLASSFSSFSLSSSL